MKIQRSELKAIVKECLIELLQDGLGGIQMQSKPQTNESSNIRNRDNEPLPGQRRTSNQSQIDPLAVRRRTMDLMENGRQQLQPHSKRENHQMIPQPFADNPMMASIFADTARTTLMEQENPSSAMAGDSAAQAVAGVDPIDLFGDDKVDIWNRAAFAPASPGLLSSPMAMLTKDD